MRIKSYVTRLAVCTYALVYTALATAPLDGLEKYDYSQLYLLKVIPGEKGAACFGTPSGRIWIHLNENVGSHFGTIDSIEKDRVGIYQPTPANGRYIYVHFFWPVADGVSERAKACGDIPDR